MPSFTKERSLSLPGPDGSPIRAEIHTHQPSGLRVVLAPFPGPLTSTSIVIPTTSSSDKGLPHTLEHLIFCGSRDHPNRGYLDTLAQRTLSAATNAYTADDHTAYTVTNAGAEGTSYLLPTFLDHVLRPTLVEDAFVTEVFHLDGEGKRQGVVYSEMSSRENTEGDLADLCTRRLLYAPTSTYAHESGGLTPSIATLSNQECRDYHAQYYAPHLSTVILVGGDLRPDHILPTIVNHPSLASAPSTPTPLPPLHAEYHEGLGQGDLDAKAPATTVPFPSTDPDVGSIHFDWKGPDVDDALGHAALNVLIYYLQSTPSSPLKKTFVECPGEAWANQVHVYIRDGPSPTVDLTFYGVPYGGDEDGGGDDEEGGSGDEDDEGESEEEEEEEEEDITDEERSPPPLPDDLFAENVFWNKLRSLLEAEATDGCSLPRIHAAIDQEALSRAISLESTPHEVINDQLTYIAVVGRYKGAASGQEDWDREDRIAKAYTTLKDKSQAWWKDLLRSSFLSHPPIEVHLIPDAQLGPTLEAEAERERQRVRREQGEEGLRRLADRVKRAIRAMEVKMPSEEVRKRMPPIPQLATIPRIPYTVRRRSIPPTESSFWRETVEGHGPTSFVHTDLLLPTSHIPASLSPFLVLLIELTFKVPIQRIPTTDPRLALPLPLDSEHKDGAGRKIGWEEVSEEMSRDSVEHAIAIGKDGRCDYAATFLEDYIQISGVAEVAKAGRLLRWFAHALAGSVYAPARLRTIIGRMLTDIAEMRREAQGAVSAAILWVERGSSHPGPGRSHAWDLSILRQEPFLRSQLALLKGGEGAKVAEKLNALRSLLLSPHPTRAASILHIATPPGWRDEHFPEATPSSACAAILDGIWSGISSPSPAGTAVPLPDSAAHPVFPLPRSIIQPIEWSPGRSRGVVVPVSSLTASMAILRTPLGPDLEPRGRDWAALRLLCELLSRSEGPLWTRIRGQGFAYGASVHPSWWLGSLSFRVHDAADLGKSLRVFWDLILELRGEEAWAKTCREWEVEAARASLAFERFEETGDVGGAVGVALNGYIRGYLGGPEEAWEDELGSLEAVTLADLRTTFERHFLPFLSPGVLGVMATPPGDIRKQLEAVLENPCGMDFEEHSLKELEAATCK